MSRFEHRFVAMGGPCRLRLDCEGDGQAQAVFNMAEQEVERLEARYSRFRENSLVSRINRAAGGGESVPIDSETHGLLNYCDTLYRESEGLFDITSGCLRQAWDFRSGKLPGQDQLTELLSLVGWATVEWDESCIRLPREGMEIDFGGCVKEYAADSVANMLQQQGITHALVDFAGDIVTLGEQEDGYPWQVGIRHPRERANAVAQVPLRDLALASSGDYERCIELEGQRYSHILDPRTGWPAQGLVAVSVIADQCLVAGSTATIAMLKPRDIALEWLDSLGLPWLAVDDELGCHGTIA